MDHGCFFVQMAGEAIVAPPNSPHAVVALQSDYIVGQTFIIKSGSVALDPCTVQADIAAGIATDKACETRIKQLQSGLSDRKFRQTYVGQFIETWLADAEILRRNNSFDDLVEVWADDIRGTETCVWCEHISANTGDYAKLDDRKHARAHLIGDARLGVPGKRRRSDSPETSGSEYLQPKRDRRRKRQGTKRV